MANALRTPVQVANTAESGALGAAAMGGIARGMFSSPEQIQEFVTSSAPTDPTENSGPYWQEIISQFQDAAEALGPWWKEHQTNPVAGI